MLTHDVETAWVTCNSWNVSFAKANFLPHFSPFHSSCLTLSVYYLTVLKHSALPNWFLSHTDLLLLLQFHYPPLVRDLCYTALLRWTHNTSSLTSVEGKQQNEAAAECEKMIVLFALVSLPHHSTHRFFINSCKHWNSIGQAPALLHVFATQIFCSTTVWSWLHE